MQFTVGTSRAPSPWYAKRNSLACAAIEKRTPAQQAELDRLLSDQAKAGRVIKDAFLKAVDRLGDKIDVDQITALLNQGRVDQAIALVDQATISQGWQPVAAAISTATIAAGVSAAQAIDALGALEISFGVTNPQTVAYLRTYELSRLRGLTADSLDSVRRVIENGITTGRNPLSIAAELRDFIGLSPTQTQAVLNYRSYLKRLDSAALDRALRDARLDPRIADAIRTGTALSDEYIDKAVAAYARRYLKYRSEVIARTEGIRAVNTGNHLLWKQTVTDGKLRADQIKRQWIYTHDDRTRPAHRLIPSMNPDGVGLNEPFSSILGPILYPGDPDADISNTANCRCTVFTRFKL